MVVAIHGSLVQIYYIINARPTFMPCMYFLNWTTSAFSCMFDDVYLKETVQYQSPILAFPRPHLPHRPLFICFFVLVSLCYPCMHTRALPAASTEINRARENFRQYKNSMQYSSVSFFVSCALAFLWCIFRCTLRCCGRWKRAEWYMPVNLYIPGAKTMREHYNYIIWNRTLSWFSGVDYS